MSKTIKIILGIVFLAVVVVLAVVFYKPTEKGTIKIGVLSHQTGYGVAWGDGEWKGAMLAIEEINKAGGIGGVKIDSIIEDCATDISKCITATQKLVEVDNVVAIIGPTWQEFFVPIAPITEEKKTILITPSGNADDDYGKYSFSLMYTNSGSAMKVVEFLKENNLKKIALVTEENFFFKSNSLYLKQYLKDSDLTLVEEFNVNPSETDFRTIVSRIINEKDGVDVVIGSLNQYTHYSVFVKQLKEQGFGGKIILPAYIPDPEGAEKDILRDTYKINFKTDMGFEEKFNNKYSTKISQSSKTAYEAIYMLKEAIERSGGSSSTAIADYLSQNRQIVGPYRNINLDEKGYAIYGPEAYALVKIE